MEAHLSYSAQPEGSLQYLNENDAYGVLATQPLGDYLRAIVETLKQHEARFVAVEAMLRETDMRDRVAQVEADVAELQGAHLGPEFRGDARLRAIENDLRRPEPTQRQSHPVAMTVALPPDTYLARGGADAFSASLAERIGVDPRDIQMLGSEEPTPEGYTQVHFRFNYLRNKLEPAEVAAQRLVSQARGGSLDRVLGTNVVDAYRPHPSMALLEESPLSRAGFGRHTVGCTVPALLGSLTSAQARITRNEFWIHHAREYFRKLRAYKKKRWKGNEAQCQQLLVSCQSVLRGIYYRKLRRYAEASKRARRILTARERATRHLLRSTQQGLLRVYYAKWMGWLHAGRDRRRRLNKAKNAADALQRTTGLGARRRCYNTWLAYTTRRRKRRNLLAGLGGANSRILLARYYAKLCGYYRKGVVLRKKQGATDVLSIVNKNALRAKYYRKLQRYAQAAQTKLARRRLQWKIAQELQGRSAKGRAQDTFDKLRNYARMRVRARERAALDELSNYYAKIEDPDAHAKLVPRVSKLESRCNGLDERCNTIDEHCNDADERAAATEGRVDDLAHRSEGLAGQVEGMGSQVEGLGNQVDVSLKTLTNTNSVLNKLVDRLISVDEQLDHLDKEKMDRSEVPQHSYEQGAVSQPLPQERHSVTKPAPSTQAATPATMPEETPAAAPAPAPLPAPEAQPLPSAAQQPSQPSQQAQSSHTQPSHAQHLQHTPHTPHAPHTQHTQHAQPSQGQHSFAAHPQPPSGVPTSSAVTPRGQRGGVLERRDLSPPRARHEPARDSKEAEQFRLLQVERARLQEVEANRAQLQKSLVSGPATGRWGLPAPVPTTEDTLARARQWQRESATTMYNTPSISPALPRSHDPGWRLT